MGMSTHVSGIRDLDGKFAQMLNLKAAHDDAGMKYSPDLEAYFQPVSTDGYDLASMEDDDIRRVMSTINVKDAVTEESYDSTSAFVVDISKLPEGCKGIRVENSW